MIIIYAMTGTLNQDEGTYITIKVLETYKSHYHQLPWMHELHAYSAALSTLTKLLLAFDTSHDEP
jgi:hypothetical protein